MCSDCEACGLKKPGLTRSDCTYLTFTVPDTVAATYGTDHQLTAGNDNMLAVQ